MKYFIAHVIALIFVASALIIPMWNFFSIHFAIKIIVGFLLLLLSGFFVERIASRWINRLVATLFPDT
jgi:hypothetical protein